VQEHSLLSLSSEGTDCFLFYCLSFHSSVVKVLFARTVSGAQNRLYQTLAGVVKENKRLSARLFLFLFTPIEQTKTGTLRRCGKAYK
jgi:hypothetical protein